METISSEVSNSGKSYIVFFDLDLTITGATSGREIAKRAFREGFMSRVDFAQALYLSILYRFNLKDSHKIVEEMTGWVKGMSEKSLIDLSSQVVHEVLLPSVYPEARAEIKHHKEQNAHVVLLSSTLTYICREIALNLGISDTVCSDLEVENGYMTGRPVGHLCFGDEKRIRLTDYCRKNDARISDAWYYGDSVSDFAALNIVGNPRCVNPDKNLRRVALKRGWKILDWNN